MAYSVYISSTSEFREIREKIIAEIEKEYEDLYEVVSMENYTAEDIKAIDRCRRDVALCDIYVCILGCKYGTIVNDGQGFSFTHLEFKEASEKKIPRLIFLKDFPPEKKIKDETVNLANLKNGITQEEQLLASRFDDDEQLPRAITRALNKHVANFKNVIDKIKEEKEKAIKEKGWDNDKIYFCNRKEISQEFRFNTDKDKDPLQFFLLACHENDLPDYFFKRNKIQFGEKSPFREHINIEPTFPDYIEEFEDAENYIKGAILEEIAHWNKFNNLSDVSINGFLEYMNEQQKNCLAIVWNINQSIWTNKKFRDFVNTFYTRYNALNKNLKTDKRILFFGIIQYTQKSELPIDKFFKQIKNIKWEYNLQKLKMIDQSDIKDWIKQYNIEYLDSKCNELINLYLENICKGPMYYRDIEIGLLNILRHNS